MRVVVAMSGGVDSSVAAAKLVEEGHDVIGVHMRLHDRGVGFASAGHDRGVGFTTAGHCCGLDDASDARRVADRLGIPFYVLDLRDAFKAAVMDDLADGYLAGRTPSPCIRCNGVLKFRVLLARALALGADRLATGHYARIRAGAVAAAADPDKDQSYFLFQLAPKAIERTIFPLGELTKPEVRAHAARLGLPVADKPESMEVCFLPDDDHTAFVKEARPDRDGAGEIVDEEGRVLGRHDAYFRYTVGQRRGLGVALGQPAYVLRVEPDTRRVVVTTDPAKLGAMGLRASGATWVDPPSPDRTVEVRVRHRARRVPAKVTVDGARFEVRFEEPVRAVAPGQAAVVYDGDRVLGGGWIEGVA